MVERQEIEDIIKKAQKLSIYSLKNLCELLNLNSDIILNNLPSIRFGKLGKKTLGEYAAEDNQVILNSHLIIIMSRALKKQDKDAIKDKLIKKIAEIITHEIIHSLRTITKKQSEMDNIYLAKVVMDLYSNSEYDEDKEERKRVVCYILNESKEEFEKLLQTKDEMKINKRIDELQDLINKQESLEECLTDALAHISINTLLHKKPLNQTISSVINDPKMRLDTVIGAIIIQNFDEEMIKWFLTTKTNPDFEDIFKIEFKDEYSKLLSIVNTAYRETVNFGEDEKMRKSTISKLKEVLENTKNNSKII